MDYIRDLTTVDANTSLYLAAKEGNYFRVSELIEAKTDLNIKTTAGEWTPLYTAIFHRSYSIATLLIKSGADVDCRTVEGDTPLHIAALRGNYDLVYTLLEAGAQIDAKNDIGLTPLRIARASGQHRIVKLLQIYVPKLDVKEPDCL